MSTFSAKGTDIDVEAVMANIRRKIEEKRKGLYTEDEVREIAEMKLDAVLDSQKFNSDFVAAFKARDEQWNYRFDPETIYKSSRPGGGGFIRFARRLLNPVLKLMFNPNPIISALSRQSDLNRYYVVLLHTMANEMTQLNLELTNLKATLRTLGIRVDFQTKREKTLEQLTASRENSNRGRPSISREGRDRPDREKSGGRSGASRDSGRGRSAGRGSRDGRAAREAAGSANSGSSSGEGSDNAPNRRRPRGGRRSYRRRRGREGGSSREGTGGNGGDGGSK